MKLFAGIDGGQTSTVALVADEQGILLGRGTAGPCDHVGQRPESTRFAEAIEGAIANALREAKLPPSSEFAAIVAGISGYEGTIVGVEPQLRTRHIRYLHDARIAHAGAFEGRPGIVLIAGTGSVAYGRNARGEEITVGGWGFLFGDEGSAFAIARHALAVAMRSEDAARASTLGPVAMRYFGVPTLRELAHKFYTNGIDRPRLASFAVEIFKRASEGDSEAGSILDDGAIALAVLGATCAARLGYAGEGFDVALCGGALESREYRSRVTARISGAMPHARVTTPSREPAAGALFLAYQEDRA